METMKKKLRLNMSVQTAEGFVYSDLQKVFAHTQACVTYRSITVRSQTKTDRAGNKSFN